MPDSGVRSWWVANETKSLFICAISRSCVTSCTVIVRPVVRPAASWVGRAPPCRTRLGLGPAGTQPGPPGGGPAKPAGAREQETFGRHRRALAAENLAELAPDDRCRPEPEQVAD